MQVDIQSIHFKADKKLIDFISQKVQKTETFISGVRSADVYLKLESDQEGENKLVEIKLNLNGNPIFAKEQAVSFETATDKVLDKLVAQAKKMKEKSQEK
jgi:putative sigma-54 modulation protein